MSIFVDVIGTEINEILRSRNQETRLEPDAVTRHRFVTTEDNICGARSLRVKINLAIEPLTEFVQSPLCG